MKPTSQLQLFRAPPLHIENRQWIISPGYSTALVVNSVLGQVGTHILLGTALPLTFVRHLLMLMWEVNKAAPMLRAPLGSAEHSPETWSSLPFWSRLYAWQKSEKPFCRTGKLVILRVVAAAAPPETAMALTIRMLKVCIVAKMVQ